MADSSNKNSKSSVLAALYGNDYENELGSGCISFENEDLNRKTKLFMRLLALGLLIINIVMSIVLFPLWSLLTFLTNWGMLVSFACILFLMYCASIPDIKLYKRTLCAVHILFEFASILNLVIPIIYWTLIHTHVIQNFKGYQLVHMYTVHIFPTFGLFLMYKSMDISLCANHCFLFAPITILYSVINYLETKSREKRCLGPQYWFITWKDYTTIVICIGIFVVFSMFYIGLAKLTKLTKHEKNTTKKT